MAEQRGFLERWSARKRARSASPAEGRRESAAPAVAPEAIAEPTAEPTALGPPPSPPAGSPPELPPLESIDAGGSIKPFLQQGVPQGLRRTALRRLWSANATIREFREVADYDWDFNAPGYGALSPADDPRALAQRLLGSARKLLGAARQPPESGQPADAQTPTMPPAIEAPGPTADSTWPRTFAEAVEQAPLGAAAPTPTPDSTYVRKDAGTAGSGATGRVMPGRSPIQVGPTVDSTCEPADLGGEDGGDVSGGGGDPDGMNERLVEDQTRPSGGAGQGDPRAAVEGGDVVRTAIRHRHRRRHGGAVPR